MKYRILPNALEIAGLPKDKSHVNKVRLNMTITLREIKLVLSLKSVCNL